MHDGIVVLLVELPRESNLRTVQNYICNKRENKE